MSNEERPFAQIRARIADLLESQGVPCHPADQPTVLIAFCSPPDGSRIDACEIIPRNGYMEDLTPAIATSLQKATILALMRSNIDLWRVTAITTSNGTPAVRWRLSEEWR